MAANDFMTEAEFKLRYPEFASLWNAKPEMLTAFLCDAEQRIDKNVFGDKTRQAHGLLTAHSLAVAPNGQMARMSEKEGDTTYWMQFKQVRSETVFGVAVSGGEQPIPPCP